MRTGFQDLSFNMDDAGSVYSVQNTTSSIRRPNRRNQPRKTQMIFQDVKQKLAEMCMESEEMTKNMNGIEKNIKNKDSRRLSLGSDSSINFGNESFMRTLKIPEIEEVDEEEEFEEDMVRDKAYSIKIKDEISNCKSKMLEYMDLIKEMTLEVERVDQENEILCDDLEAEREKVDQYEIRIENLQQEKDDWTKKFLAVLDELEKSNRLNDEIEEKLVEKEKEVIILNKQTRKIGGEEEVLKDIEMLLTENDKLKSELTKLKNEREETKRQNIDLEENVHEVQDSYNDLNVKLKMVMEKKDFFMKKIKEIENDKIQSERMIKTDLNEQIMNYENELKRLQTENRELNDEVKKLRTKNLELQSELDFQGDKDMDFGLTSQLENSKFLLDITQDMGDSNFHKDLNMTDMNIQDSYDQKMLEPEDEQNNYGNEMLEELRQKKEQVEELEGEKERILKSKQEEILELEDKLIQKQKDLEFEISSMEKRFAHEKKIWKKEKKKLTKEMKQMEKKLVSLKVQTSNLFVEKDEIEMQLSKKIRLLTIKIQEYEKNIKEFNMISKTKDSKGFWKKLFN
jgi:hypothetical protein